MVKNEKDAMWWALDCISVGLYDELQNHISSSRDDFQEALCRYLNALGKDLENDSSTEIARYFDEHGRG